MPAARLIILVVVGCVVLASGSTDGQIRRHPDDATTLGTRIAPLPPGEGGQLIVSAPAVVCADGGHLLDISYSPGPGLGPGTVIHIPAGPSSCVWDFDGLAAGDYWGAIEHQPDGQILATARAQVVRGAAQVMSLTMVAAEIEGILTVNGLPPPEGVRLMFGPTSRPGLAWNAPFDAYGAYRVTLDASGDQTTCARLERVTPLNASGPKCARFAPGLQRFDLDFTMPSGVIGIEVLPNGAGLVISAV
jgi:hypothetical protein